MIYLFNNFHMGVNGKIVTIVKELKPGKKEIYINSNKETQGNDTK